MSEQNHLFDPGGGLIGANFLNELHYDPSQIDIIKIARSLSRQCRYIGHLRPGIEHYSVAQHCVLVSEIVPENLALCG